MSESSLTATRVPGSRFRLLTLALLAAAVAVGVLAVGNPVLAAGVAIAAVAVPAALLRPKLIMYLLTVTVFAEFLTVGGITIGRLAAPLAALAIFTEFAQSTVRFRSGAFLIALVCGYAGIAVASLLWTQSTTGSFAQLGSLAIALVYMASFAVFVRDDADLRRVFGIVTVSAVVLGLYWIGSQQLGIARSANAAGDPNFFAADQVVALPMILVLAVSSRPSFQRLMLYLAIAIVAASVIASLSRGGALSLVVEIALILILPGSLFFRTRSRKITFFVASGIGLALILPFAGAALSHRFQSGLQASQLGGRRADLWLAALHAYSQHPALGIGYGAFQPTMFQWVAQTPGVQIKFFSPSILVSGQPVHNSYLETLTELGPLGLAFFIGLLLASIALLARSVRVAKRRGLAVAQNGAAALLVGLVAFSCSAIFLPTETSRVMWMIVGLAIALSRLSSRRATQLAEADFLNLEEHAEGSRDDVIIQPNVAS